MNGFMLSIFMVCLFIVISYDIRLDNFLSQKYINVKFTAIFKDFIFVDAMRLKYYTDFWNQNGG